MTRGGKLVEKRVEKRIKKRRRSLLTLQKSYDYFLFLNFKLTSNFLFKKKYFEIFPIFSVLDNYLLDNVETVRTFQNFIFINKLLFVTSKKEYKRVVACITLKVEILH